MYDYFLADDLSGALDAGGAFLRAGRRVRISLRSGEVAAGSADEVLAITTETRNADPAAAAAVVSRVIDAHRAQGGRLVYKKIDSTLRGPVAAELEALMAALPDARVLFAPANPRVGRTVQDGVLRVRGIPVAETEFGRDPAWPLRDSRVRGILGATATPRVVVPDTVDPDDLLGAVQNMDAGPGPWVPVGSGALAVPIAARAAPTAAASGETSLPAGDASPVPGSPVLLVGGSAHPLNRDQAEQLRQIEGAPIHELDFGDPTRAVTAAIADLSRVGTATLQVTARRTTAQTALRAITEAAVRVIETARVHRLFVTGGETAFAICERLGVDSLALLAELEPGLGLVRAQSTAGPLLLAIKPGGFGDPHTWIRACARLRA
ncbi:MAG TPA: four-carbon acid sugar kinase family protein [Opitutaceae bacterium]|nr:four-carbon acid sugar kinase family protein [Opitutaceae bacterium]